MISFRSFFKRKSSFAILLLKSFINIINQIKMGNQCCESGNHPGEIPKSSFSKFQYTFQEDHEELPNPILQTSKLTNYLPPNEYSEREICQ